MTKKTRQLNIAISPEVSEKLEKGNYNKNKLINELLMKFLDKQECTEVSTK